MLALFVLCLTRNVLTSHCPGKSIDDTDRGDFLDYHNLIRRQVAQGVARKDVGTLKPGKEMYELRLISLAANHCIRIVEAGGKSRIYDCALEEAAAKSVRNTCSGYLDVFQRHGHNKYMVFTSSLLKLGRKNLIPEAVESWYSPAIVYGLHSAYNKFEDPRLETFANIVHDKNLGIGCYYAECTTGAPIKAVFACVYEAYIVPNQLIYETGTACVDDFHCTTYPNSICVSHLCITPVLVPYRGLFHTTRHSKQITTPPPSIDGMCPGNLGVMTDAIREKILQMHNWRRSQLALGNIKNGKNNYNCPTASNMYKMAYDCNLEKNALAFASQCTLANSASSSRQGEGENVHIGSLTTDLHQTGSNAVEAWWSQIFRNGLNQRMLFTTNLRDKPAAPLAFTQMGWAMSVKLGCGIATCRTNTFTVCRYSAAGNIVGQQIYIPGTPCAACPGKCITAEGLCATP